MFQKFFDLDNIVWDFFAKLCNAFIVGVLWILTSLPVVTAGASTTAMYDVLLRTQEDRNTSVFKQYFKSFKLNFKRSTAVWLPLFLVTVVDLFDFYFFSHFKGMAGYAGMVMSVMAGILIILFTIYIFPLIAKFENTFKQTIKNAFLMPIKHFWCSLWALAYAVLVIVLAVNFPPLIIFLPGVTAFAISFPIYYVFSKYIPKYSDSNENPEE